MGRGVQGLRVGSLPFFGEAARVRVILSGLSIGCRAAETFNRKILTLRLPREPKIP